MKVGQRFYVDTIHWEVTEIVGSTRHLCKVGTKRKKVYALDASNPAHATVRQVLNDGFRYGIVLHEGRLIVLEGK
jgi:hypothetical protein